MATTSLSDSTLHGKLVLEARVQRLGERLERLDRIVGGLVERLGHLEQDAADTGDGP